MTSVVVKNLIITSTEASTSTSTGAIVCGGGMGIAGNINITGNIVSGGTIIGNSFSTSNILTLTDGVNSGTIRQLGTELTLSSSGSKIVLANNNSLVFKSDNTVQYTAYTGREIVDDCDTHTYIYNSANPSTPKYMLSSTFALNQCTPVLYNTTATTTYAYPIRLVKGQVINGAGFDLSASGSPQVGFMLYNTANPAAQLATTSANNNVPTTGMNYLSYSNPYTILNTGIYYTCIYVNSIGGGLSLIATPANSYLNYGQITMSPGVLNKAAQKFSGAPGATLSGITMTLESNVGYSVVYS